MDGKGRTAIGWGEAPLSVQWVWPSKLAYAARHQALKDFCQLLAQAWAQLEREDEELEQIHFKVLAYRRDHPDEACGVIAGPAGSDRPERFVPMLNAARSPTFFEFDSQDLFRLYRDVDERDEEIVVIYHSHTATEAYPSRTDIQFGSLSPDSHWVLVSTRDPDEVEFRSFRIADGAVTEEPVAIVPAERQSSVHPESSPSQ